MNKVIRIALIVIVSIIVILGIRNEMTNRIITDFTITQLQNQIEDLTNEQNNLLYNDIELAKMIQENDKVTGDFLDKLTEYTQDNIEKLTEKVEITDINKMLNSSVFVKGLMGLGSGTIIKKTDTEMYILTCNHVVDDIIAINEQGNNLKATIGYSKTDNLNRVAGLVVYSAEIIAYDRDIDLALLKTNIVDDTLEVRAIAKNEPEKGDLTYTVGNPLGALRTISKGVLVNKIEGFFMTDNTTTYGNSGGGLFNSKGELIGVPSNVAGYSGGLDRNGNETFIPESSLGLARDLQTIRKFLEGKI